MAGSIDLPPTLDTGSLSGRPPTSRDVVHMRTILQDARAMRWLSPDGKVVTDARVAWLTDRLAAHWEAHDFGPRLFFRRDGGPIPKTGLEPPDSFVGWCGLRHQLVDGVAEIELLYALRPDLWRQGFGRAMARATLDEGFARIDAASVVAFTLPDNRASRGVMERCGMTYERDITHAGLPHVLYRKTGPAAV